MKSLWSRTIAAAMALALLGAILMAGCGGGSNGGAVTIVANPFQGGYTGTYTLANGETGTFRASVDRAGRTTLILDSPVAGRITMTGSVDDRSGVLSATGAFILNGASVTITAAGQVSRVNNQGRLSGTLALSNNNNGSFIALLGTVGPTATPAPTATGTPQATAVPTAIPTATPTATPRPTPTGVGVFAGSYTGTGTFGGPQPYQLTFTVSSTGALTGTVREPVINASVRMNGTVTSSGRVTATAGGPEFGYNLNFTGNITRRNGTLTIVGGTMTSSVGQSGSWQASGTAN